jgi:hypothetical protein
VATRKQSSKTASTTKARAPRKASRAIKADPVVETPAPIETPAAPETDASVKERKPRKPSLTLSQRRALLRLQDAGDDGVTPSSAFRALPFEHLRSVGYADVDADGAYTLTDDGRDRADAVNPGYRAWAAGETVADDPTRPTAGEHRAIPTRERETPMAWIAHL